MLRYLKETMISNLKCAAAPRAFAFVCQHLLTRLLSHTIKSERLVAE